MVGPSYGTTTLKEFFKNVAENGLQVCRVVWVSGLITS